MTPIKNLVIDKGATFIEYITYIDDNKAPISLEGYTVLGQMRKSFYSANAVTFITTIIDAANANVSLALSSSSTANLAIGRYVYDVLASQGETVKRITEGIVTVTPSVTTNS